MIDILIGSDVLVSFETLKSIGKVSFSDLNVIFILTFGVGVVLAGFYQLITGSFLHLKFSDVLSPWALLGSFLLLAVSLLKEPLHVSLIMAPMVYYVCIAMGIVLGFKMINLVTSLLSMTFIGELLKGRRS